MNAKEPKYYCVNCEHLFVTGRFSRSELKEYDNVCPWCGAMGLTLKELAEEYEDLWKDYSKLKRKKGNNA